MDEGSNPGLVARRAASARRRRRVQFIVAGGAGLVIVGAAGAYGLGLIGSASPASQYQTATARLGSVQQTLVLNGTVTRVHQMNATFPVNGQVRSVDVSVGQQVTKGQKLATLNTAALNVSLLQAQASLAKAEAAVAADTAAPASSSGTAAGSAGRATSTAPATASTPTSTHSGTSTPQLAQLAALMKDLSGALSAQDSTCQGLFTPTGTSPVTPAQASGPESTSSATGSGSPLVPSEAPTPAQTSETPPPAQTSEMSNGSRAANPGHTEPTHGGATTDPSTPSAQQSGPAPDATKLHGCLVATQSLATVETKAAALLRSASSASTGTSTSPTRTATTTPTTRTTAVTSTAGGSAAGGGSSSGASGRLPSDEAAVTSAEQAVAQAESNLAGATLVAPMSGTVGTVALTPGLAAGSTSGITIVGSGASTITVNVPLTNRAVVAVGQQAQITPPGGGPSLTGHITAISALPNSTGSVPTYPATISVADSPAALTTNAQASVSVIVRQTANTLTVPVSAVTPQSTSQGTVSLLQPDGTIQTARVTTGAIGAGSIAVVSGLQQGDTVILADLTQPLPTNTTQNLGRLTGGGGGQFGPGGGAAGQGGTGTRAGTGGGRAD